MSLQISILSLYYIARNSSTNYEIIGFGLDEPVRIWYNPGIPGHFQLMARVYWSENDNDYIETNVVHVEHQFPSVDDILRDHIVQINLETAWQQTLSLCTGNQLAEVGSIIYYDTHDMGYKFGFQSVTSSYEDFDNKGYIGLNLNKYPDDPNPSTMPIWLNGGRFPVGHFHVHPPISRLDSIYDPRRIRVGPSDPDITAIPDLPGIIVTLEGDGSFYYKTTLETSARINKPYGPYRRATP